MPLRFWRFALRGIILRIAKEGASLTSQADYRFTGFRKGYAGSIAFPRFLSRTTIVCGTLLHLPRLEKAGDLSKRESPFADSKFILCACDILAITTHGRGLYAIMCFVSNLRGKLAGFVRNIIHRNRWRRAKVKQGGGHGFEAGSHRNQLAQDDIFFQAA
jgi:hypothetical protein